MKTLQNRSSRFFMNCILDFVDTLQPLCRAGRGRFELSNNHETPMVLDSYYAMLYVSNVYQYQQLTDFVRKAHVTESNWR